MADTIEVQKAATVKAVGIPKQKMVRIVLEDNENIPPTGQPISLNGKAYIIVPGHEVDVPVGIVEILQNAITTVPIQDPATRKVVGSKNRQRFAFRVVRDAA